MSNIFSRTKIIIFVCVLLGISLFVMSNLFSREYKNTKTSEWVRIAIIKEMNIALEVDINSFKMAIDQKNLQHSLIGIRSRFVSLSPEQPLPPELLNVFVSVIDIQSCIAENGKMLIGPESDVNQSQHVEWSMNGTKMFDFLGIASCSLASEKLESQNRRKAI